MRPTSSSTTRPSRASWSGRFREDLAASVEIDPQAWRRRGLGQRFKEWLARQWEYLL
jgi:hypothetical protein